MCVNSGGKGEWGVWGDEEVGVGGFFFYLPVISSGKMESRTSRSSICSSRPMFPW